MATVAENVATTCLDGVALNGRIRAVESAFAVACTLLQFSPNHSELTTNQKVGSSNLSGRAISLNYLPAFRRD